MELQTEALFSKTKASHPESWGRILVVAAHPDDEVLAIGGHFKNVHLQIFHLTTGAGFLPIPNLFEKRKAEVRRALAIGGIPYRRLTLGSEPDLGVANAIPRLIDLLKATIDRISPDCLLTHSYEGGHPDHDGASLICNLAAQGRIPIYEFTSYHNRTPLHAKVSIETNRFLGSEEGQIIVPLSIRQQRLKRRMLRCFHTQSKFLQNFSIADERFRLAPNYDYTKPPHQGMLLYESWGFGLWKSALKKEF